jgi:hypothetical protein
LSKVRDDSASAFLEMRLKVPRGLWSFLENLQRVGGLEPKNHLEMILSKELECLLGNLPNDIFDLKSIRARYGEGSDLCGETDSVISTED